MTDPDEKLIIEAANRVGLHAWQLDREIVEVIKYALNKYKYWYNIEKEIKARLDVDNR